MARVGFRRVLSFGFPFEAFTRDIKLICVSNFIGAFGEGLYIFVLSLYLLDLHASIVEVGAFFSIMYLSSALAPIPGGILADRYDRKKVIFVSWALWVFTPLIYYFSNNWVEMIPGGILWGASMLGLPAINAYIVTAAKDRTKTATLLATFISTWSLGYIFSPAIGGYLTDAIGMKQVLLITTLFSAVCTSMYLLISSQHAPRQTEHESTPQPISRDIKKRLFAWSVFYAAVLFAVQTARTLIAPFLTVTLSVDRFYVGVFGSINFAGTAFLGLLVAHVGDRWSRVRGILLCLLMHVSTVLVMLFTSNSAFLLFTAFFWGGAVTYSALINSAIGAIAPEASRARWISIPMTTAMIAAVVAPYLSGYLYEVSPYMPFSVSLIATIPVILLLLAKPFREY